MAWPAFPVIPITLAGVAWDGPGGGTHWGWPDGEGRVERRHSDALPEVCVALPPAIALALALRGDGVDPGSRCLVVGPGYLGRLALAVATRLGCRARGIAAPAADRSIEGPRPDIVIETTGGPGSLSWSLAQCRDWGAVFSCGAATTAEPLDYYADVHRRALRLHQVPPRPWLRPGEDAIVDRGVPLLVEALQDLRSEGGDRPALQGLPPEENGVAIRERPGGWCLVRAGFP